MYYVYVCVCMRGKVCVGGCAHVHAYVKLVQTCHTVCGGKRTTFGSLPSLWELGTALSLSGYMTSILSTVPALEYGFCADRSLLLGSSGPPA